MWKARGRNWQNRCDCRSVPQSARKCLYLILEDWKEGLSIHKIDTYNSQSARSQLAVSSQVPESGSHLHLSEPALRLEASVDNSDVFLAAVRNKIFIATPAPTFIYKTNKEKICVGPSLPDPLLGAQRTAVAIGKKLYVLSSRCGGDNQQQHSFVVMSLARCFHQDRLPSPPFGSQDFVTSSAVHPDERTIFMSTCQGTYSFDTENYKWAIYGTWVLPFRGQGYFSCYLDAWVGIDKNGYICTCDVPSSSATVTKEPPRFVMGRKKLLSNYMIHPSDSLVCTGENMFCLVKVEPHMEVGVVDHALGVPDDYLLRLAVFHPTFSHKGGLKTTMVCPIRSYLVPRYRDTSHCRAFSM